MSSFLGGGSFCGIIVKKRIFTYLFSRFILLSFLFFFQRHVLFYILQSYVFQLQITFAWKWLQLRVEKKKIKAFGWGTSLKQNNELRRPAPL